MESVETQLGQLAIARGMIELGQLLKCMETAVVSERMLTDVMISEGLISNAQYEELVARLQDVQSVKRELELGNTIVVDQIERSRSEIRDSWASPVTMEFDPSDLLLDGESRYEFKEELGRGGMGQVKLAHDLVMHRDVAIKMLLPSMQNEKGRNRLLTEAQVTGLLEHPNIAPIYDLRELASGEPFYTMRVVRERSLEQILAAVKSGEEEASLTNLVGILRQVTLAIQYAHDRGVVHRDLKPENILIGKYGEVYVIDWGIAKVVHAQLGLESTEKIVMGQLVGTPQYMAPEQARGDNENVDGRSDVYALGAILYEILTLAPMFEADHVLSLLFQVVHDDPLPPSERAPDRTIPPELEEICLRAVAKDPANRFQTAEELAEELELFLEGVKEREKQRQAAEEALEQARQFRAVYEDVRAQRAEIASAVVDEARKVESWFDIDRKSDLYALEQQVEDLGVESERRFGETIRMYAQALAHVSGHPEARHELADLYWTRFAEAEAQGNLANAAYFEGLVRQYNDGHLDDKLEGTAILQIATDPPGATIHLSRYEREGRRLAEWEVLEFGPTPEQRMIAHGSYVADVALSGRRNVRVPFVIGRSETKSIHIRLLEPASVPDDFVIVPGGPYERGGDIVTVDSFAIQRTPVTCGQYLEFLNSIDPNQAAEHAPRIEDRESYFPMNESGQYELPGTDAEGDEWDLEWPILLVNFHDASAFAAWRAARDGHQYRLPTADEWEKAARGADGRLYPWGNDFDASFCSMRESTKGKPNPANVGSYQFDRSPYGVMDMAGNIAEWTSTPETPGSERVLLKGGSYNSMAVVCRLDEFMASPKEFRYSHYGFRLVLPLGQ